MVTEAVAEMKGEEVRPPAEVKLDVPTDAHLPRDYVGKEELRLEAYRRLAGVTTHDEVEDIRAEWEDRYGPVPEPAAALLAVGHLRAECFRLGLRDVSITSGQARLGPVMLKASEVLRLRRVARDAIYKEGPQQLVLPLRRGADPAAYLLEVLAELFPDDARLTAAAGPTVSSRP
jgi:transcription-repair coupling factor (superfamily II helicase)